MENQDNIAGLGKNHDQEAHENDLAKKQSEAKPGAENIEMEPHSVNMQGNKGFGSANGPNNEETSSNDTTTDEKIADVHEEAGEYAKQEHEKAENWENNNVTGPDTPQF